MGDATRVDVDATAPAYPLVVRSVVKLELEVEIFELIVSGLVLLATTL